VERPVLVTGASGFIGRHLVRALIAQGIPVRALVRRESPRGLWPEEAGVEIVVGDLLDGSVARCATAGVRRVFHLAGRLFAPGVPAVAFERLHVEATLALLNECTRTDGFESFVLCSTTGVLGPQNGRLGREDDLVNPRNAYEETKARAEHEATAFARSVSLPLTIVRPGLVYGPGDRHLLGLFRAIHGGYYRVIGRGTNRFHPTYVQDAVDGILRAAGAASPGCRAYNIVGPRPATVRELSETIADALGCSLPASHLPRGVALAAGAALELLPISRRRLPLTRSRVRFLTEDRAYDGSRAAEELDFRPETSLATGMRRTVAWYRENGWL
jgi:nucleoside-diphosphate-sugar epimerase